MASVYKRKSDGKSATYFIGYTDAYGKRRTKKGFTDKRSTIELAAALERKAMLRREGLVDPTAERLAEERAPETANPGENRGYDADRRLLSPVGKTGEEWRRRESNPRPVTFPRPLLRA
jgi:hypothetical protein